VFIEAKDVGSGGDTWSYKPCKAPVKSSTPTNQHPVLLSLMMWNLQSYPTTVLNESMWPFWGQNILWPLLHIFRGSRPQTLEDLCPCGASWNSQFQWDHCYQH